MPCIEEEPSALSASMRTGDTNG
jgi:hypothetical protein